MKKLILLSGIAVMLFTSCGKKADANEAEQAFVSFLKGNAIGVIEGNESSLKKGMTIKPGDKIRTQSSTFVDLDLGERGVLRLRPNTDFSLAEYDEKKIKVDVKKGKVLSCLRKLKKNEEFYVKTPVAIAGVRGTSFMVDASSPSLKIAVLTGKVNVSSGGKDVTVSELNEVAVKDTISDQKMIRGTSFIGVKELVNVTSVEKTGELDLMKANLAKLEIVDKKNLKDKIELNKTLEADGVSGKTDDIMEKLKEQQKDYKIKQKTVNTDEDLMLDK